MIRLSSFPTQMKCFHPNTLPWRSFHRYTVQPFHYEIPKCRISSSAFGREPISVSPLASPSSLENCSSVKELKETHAFILRHGIAIDDAEIVKCYVGFGETDNIRRLFKEIPKRGRFFCNWMIREYSKRGLFEDVLRLFSLMMENHVEPDNFTFPSVLKACGNLQRLEEGREIHNLVKQRGFQSNLFIAASLVDMYIKTGYLQEARRVFDEIHLKDVVIWTAMIVGYVQKGFSEEALEIFVEMRKSNVKPNAVTLVKTIAACAQLHHPRLALQVHGLAMKNGLADDIQVRNSLVVLYSKCSNVEDFLTAVDKIGSRDVVSWTAMMTSYLARGSPKEALNVFHRMLLSGVFPDHFVLVKALSASSECGFLEEGQWIHDYIVRNGFESDISVRNSLIAMYSRFGRLLVARRLFDEMTLRDLGSWNTIISGYVQNGLCNEALMLFDQMRKLELKPSIPTLVTVLSASSDARDLYHGRWVHVFSLKSGLESDVSVSNALIAMYSKCNCLESARCLFDSMSEKDIVSWNSMISGYVQHRQSGKALELFSRLKQTKLEPNSVTILSVLPASAQTGALEQAKWIHNYLLDKGIELNMPLATSLLDMYAKCGDFETARLLFDRMPKKDVASWNAMIDAYGLHGHAQKALSLFHEMQVAGIHPNEVTFICLLSACSHAGLVDQGWEILNSMNCHYGIVPTIKHYACMVDLLGRAGRLDDAVDLIGMMPGEPDAAVWGALLSACTIHANVELAELAAEKLFCLDPENDGYYVLMSNLYARVGQWADAARMRALMKGQAVQKKRKAGPQCWV